MKDSLHFEILKQQIHSLQLKFDSVQQLSSIKQFEYELHQKQDVISQVNEFYDSAWLKLIIVISVLGILVPIIAQYFQRKNLNDLTDFIRNQMNDSLEFKIEELKNFNKVEIEKTITELKGNIQKLETTNKIIASQIDAGLFFLQARTSFSDKNYASCVADYIKSAYHWLNTDKVDRLKITFGNIINIIKLVKEKKDVDILEKLVKESIDMSLMEVATYLKNHHYMHVYEDRLSELFSEVERLKAIV